MTDLHHATSVSDETRGGGAREGRTTHEARRPDLAGAPDERERLAGRQRPPERARRAPERALERAHDRLLDDGVPFAGGLQPVDGGAAGDRTRRGGVPAALAERVVELERRRAERAVEREGVEAVFKSLEQRRRLGVGPPEERERVQEPSADVGRRRREAERMADERVQERKGREEEREPEGRRRD